MMTHNAKRITIVGSFALLALCAAGSHHAYASAQKGKAPAATAVDMQQASDEAATTAASGLPLPRFASLRFDEVNVRTGPGTRYPIRWVYKRKSLPVEIIEEFGDWRLLKDVEGDEGWSHKSQLSGARSVVMHQDVTLKRYPAEDSPPMLKARKGVTARLLECQTDWCEVQVQSYKAWVRKHHVWGVYSKEIIK